MNKILFLDIETTGTDPEKHGIFEIACKVQNQPQFYNTSCGFSGAIDIGALKYNKAYKDFNEVNKDEKDLLEDFVYYILNLGEKKPFILCGQNVHFDLNFIRKRLAKLDVSGLDSIFSYRVLDLFTLSKTALDLGLIQTNNNSLSLCEVAKALNIKVKDKRLHQALYDVELSEKVYGKLLALFGENHGNKS